MKKLLIMCGTGIVTSTIVRDKVETWLHEQQLDQRVQIFQSSVQTEQSKADHYDIIISTTHVPDSMKHKAVNGIPLLTGMDSDDVYQELLEKMTQR